MHQPVIKKPVHLCVALMFLFYTNNFRCGHGAKFQRKGSMRKNGEKWTQYALTFFRKTGKQTAFVLLRMSLCKRSIPCIKSLCLNLYEMFLKWGPNDLTNKLFCHFINKESGFHCVSVLSSAKIWMSFHL